MLILIAAENEALAGLLGRGLRGGGDTVTIALDEKAALAQFSECGPDLVVLDLDLPKRGGMEVLGTMRAADPLCSILILSGAPDASTRTACLQAGADDCLQKPFSLSELRARCQALLRRSEARRTCFPLKEGVLAHGSLELDRLARQATVSGMRLPLTNREFAILEQLLLARRAPVSRATLREAVWTGRPVEGNVVDVHMAALRRKLGMVPCAPGIETLRGLGFQLSAAVSAPSAPFAAMYATA